MESIEVPESVQTNMEKRSFNCSIPVLPGDTIGYRLQTLEDEINFFLDNTNDSADVVFYSRETADALCQLSLCDSSTLDAEHNGLAPLISVDFGGF